MLILHSRPNGITWTVSGSGATIVGDAPNLDDGRPDTLAGFTFNTGTQNTSTVFRLRADWTSGAIVPRGVGLSNLSLPAGTKITVAFRRAGDAAGTYPYAPSLLNTGNLQRVFVGPRGEQTAWLIVPSGATAVIGCEIQIYNDVAGVASIVAGAPFTVGEAVIAAGTDVVIDKDWSLVLTDSTTASYTLTRQPYLVPGTVYRTLNCKLPPSDLAKFFGDPAAPGVIDYERLFAKLDRGQSAVYIPRMNDTSGAFSAQLLHRTALIGIATKLPSEKHKSGRWFDSDAVTVIESPIPT